MKNPQLTTMEEAKETALRLATIGGGVADIYIPEYFGPYTAPEDDLSKFYHFRFRNGADGHNVGLVRMTMQNFPTSWPNMIALEVNATSSLFSNNPPPDAQPAPPPPPPAPDTSMPKAGPNATQGLFGPSVKPSAKPKKAKAPKRNSKVV